MKKTQSQALLGLNPEGLQSNKHSASQYNSIVSSGQNHRNQQYASAKEGNAAGQPSSTFLAKTSTQPASQKKGGKGSHSTKKREGEPMQQFSVNSQSQESIKGVFNANTNGGGNQKSKKQMLMLQLLQNFQEFGTFKKKQDEVAKRGLTSKNVDNKSIMLIPDGGSMLQHRTHSSKNKEGGGKQGKQAKQKSMSKDGFQIDIDQLNTRNNEAVNSKSFLNSQRIPNLESRLNGLTVAQQNKLRAQASSKQEYSERGSNAVLSDIQGACAMKKLATQELVFNTNTKKTLTKAKQSVVQRSNMTPKLGIVGLGQNNVSNSAAKANNKNQSNFARYNKQQSLLVPQQVGMTTPAHDSYVQTVANGSYAKGLGPTNKQHDLKKASAISQYASAARLMPQHSISVANPAMQQQMSVLNSAHGSTMIEPHMIQNLSQQLGRYQVDSLPAHHRQAASLEAHHLSQVRNTVQFELDPSNLVQNSGKASILSGFSGTHDMHSQPILPGTKRHNQQNQHLMNIISDANVNHLQKTSSNGRSLAKTQSAFLETQELMNNALSGGAQQAAPHGTESERELTTLNSKRKMTRFKEKKGSRNNTQSLLDNPSFKSKNSNNQGKGKLNTQKLSFAKNAISKNKLVVGGNNDPSPRPPNQHSQSTVTAVANIRSKSQKKKDMFSNIVAEAQETFAVRNGVQPNQQERAKLKKVGSTSNLIMPARKSPGQNNKTDPKGGKRLIFQSSQQQPQFDSNVTTVTTPQGMVLINHHANSTISPQTTRNLKKAQGSSSKTNMGQNSKAAKNPPTCTSPYISTTQLTKNNSQIVGGQESGFKRHKAGGSSGTLSPPQKTTMRGSSSQNTHVSPSQRLKSVGDQLGSTAMIVNPALLNFNPNPGFGLEQKVVVRRQHQHSSSTSLQPSAELIQQEGSSQPYHKRSQKYLIVNNGGEQDSTIAKVGSGVIGENVTSCTLQDYSEYQLSFRQDQPKSSQTPLDTVGPDGMFSGRDVTDKIHVHSKSPEVYQQQQAYAKHGGKANGHQSSTPDTYDYAQLMQVIRDQRRQIAKLEKQAMAVHIVKHLEHEVGQQLESANQMVHIDDNKEQSATVAAGQNNPTMQALDQLKKRMTAHVQKTQLVNQKLAYRVICLEQQVQGLTSQGEEGQETIGTCGDAEEDDDKQIVLQ